MGKRKESNIKDINTKDKDITTTEKSLPSYVRMKDIAKRLNVPRGTIYRWINDGIFPSANLKLGNLPLWEETAVVDFLESRSTKGVSQVSA